LRYDTPRRQCHAGGDGEAERDALAALLENMGFAVTPTNSGLASDQQIASRDFTIAMIDLGRPDQAGEFS
jgi:DNA-binding response OmpR family regulator